MNTSSTATLDADRLLEEALHQVWGFSGFRPLQREAMHAILASRDSVVVLPTGGGKSLCFQAPATIARDVIPGASHPLESASAGRDGGNERQGVAVVVSPLISLMKDQ